MKLPWPVRILIELLIYFLIIKLILILLKKAIRKTGLKKLIGKIFIYLGTWFVAIVGKKYTWGNDIDKKIIDIGKNIADKPFVIHPVLCKLILIGCIMCYMFCVIPGTKAFLYFDGWAAQCFLNTKDFFIKCEEKWSSGYKEYAPVIPKETNVSKKDSISSKKIIIKIDKKKKKKGVWIYKKPSGKAKKLLEVRENEKIIYKNKIEKVKKEYWIKVSVPNKKINGWMKKSYIKKETWKKIKDK